jgi:hypothetical protein
MSEKETELVGVVFDKKTLEAIDKILDVQNEKLTRFQQWNRQDYIRNAVFLQLKQEAKQ